MSKKPETDTLQTTGDRPLAIAPKLRERLEKLRDALLEGLVERDVAVKLALLAALAGEHLVLVGPPGTAKSLIARRLRLAFDGARYFERLLTRFTVPEELFGPLSIKGLEEDRYERLTDSYLPTASIAFLDEIFKANSAILNALLTLLNEREFDNGVVREKTPLVALIGASNELPEGDELAALYDRFLLRLHVGPVSAEGFGELLGLRGEAAPEVPEGLLLSGEQLAWIRASSERVAVPEDVVALLTELRTFCQAEGIAVSDRRWRKVVKLLQTSAFTNGRDKVSVWDCWLLQHCLWQEPEQREKVQRWYEARVGASAAMDPSRLTTMVTAWEQRLDKDRTSRSQARDSSGDLLYVGPHGKSTTEPQGKRQAVRGATVLFLAPVNASTQSGYQFDRHQVRDRTNGGKGYTQSELDGLSVRVDEYNDVRFKQWAGRANYLRNVSNWLLAEGANPPQMEPTRHKPEYVAACGEQLEALDAQVSTYQNNLMAHRASLKDLIASHLWIDHGFASPADRNLAETEVVVRELRKRIDALRKGFAALPCEPAVGATR